MRLVIEELLEYACTPPCPPISSHFPLYFRRRSKVCVVPWSEPLRGARQPVATWRGRGQHNKGTDDMTKVTRRGRRDKGRRDEAP